MTHLLLVATRLPNSNKKLVFFWTEQINDENIALGANINEPEQVQREDNFVKEWGLIFITCNDSSSIGRNMVAKF